MPPDPKSKPVYQSKQFHAGYILSTIHALGDRNGLLKEWADLSTFFIDGILPDAYSHSPETAVISNIISRGLPTLAPPNVEAVVSQETRWATVADRQDGIIEFTRQEESHSDDGEIQKLISRAARVIDPRIGPKGNHSDYDGQFRSSNERRFLYETMTRALGDFASQVIEPQRPLSSFNLESQDGNQKRHERVDFCLSVGPSQSIVMELDGDEHDRARDEKRDEFLADNGAVVFRIRNRDLGEVPPALANQLKVYAESDSARRLKFNYETPLHASREGMDALILALAPFSIARIQRLLAEALAAGVLDAHAKIWRIAIVEQDVPCGEIAVADFIELMTCVFRLRDEAFVPPEVELRVYNTPEFAMRKLGDITPESILAPARNFTCDLLIDVGILQKRGLSAYQHGQDFSKMISARAILIARSSHSRHGKRRIESGEFIEYNPSSPVAPAILTSLLRRIFRKSKFRPKQMEVIGTALVGRSVIALLPTGAGKSLTFQLSALLQPGTALVVNPIKSLMVDQEENLKRILIDNAEFINSDLTPSIKARRQREFEASRIQFLYISPERLTIETFRKSLDQAFLGTISFCVIDEAHCVSEWGHDFRPAYLWLAKNAQERVKKSRGELPILALTGTASFDVLADVRREIDLPKRAKAEIISPDRFARDELFFQLAEVRLPISKGAPPTRREIAHAKAERLAKLLHDASDQLGKKAADEFFGGSHPNCGIIFCPHAGHDLGVDSIRAEILASLAPFPPTLFGIFKGGDSGNLTMQSNFKTNSVRLLAATKAFGMGIDKPNVRFTAHVNFPQSIESFYQEAGRAGRDGNPAICTILYCSNPGSNPQISVDKEILLWFHDSSFPGIPAEQRTIDSLLQSGQPHETHRGISEVLKQTTANTSSVIRIPAENDAVSQATRLFSDYTGALNPGEFKEFLRSRFDRGIPDGQVWHQLQAKLFPAAYEPDNKFKNLWAAFAAIRREHRGAPQTARAIYRLAMAGIVEDYTREYSSAGGDQGFFSLKLRNGSIDDRVCSLKSYLTRYSSKVEVDRRLRDVMGRPSGVDERSLIGAQLKFVYENIAQRRLEAIGQMESAVREGLRGGDFAERINTYFDSRFTPELREFSRNQQLAPVFDFIEQRVDGHPDSLGHLLGACNRLLSEDQNNGTFLILRGYARLLLPESLDEEAFDDFRRGLASLFPDPRTSQAAKHEVLTRLRPSILRHRPNAGSILDALGVMVHTEWLKAFSDDVERDLMAGKD